VASVDQLLTDQAQAKDMGPAQPPLRQPWEALFVPIKPNKEDYYSWAIQIGVSGHGGLPQPPRTVDFSKSQMG
jgi:hypothetical protein